MQDLAHLRIDGRVLLVLRRKRKCGISIRLRRSGGLGIFLEDESIFLSESKPHLNRLMAGETLYL